MTPEQLAALASKTAGGHFGLDEDCWYTCPLALDEDGRSRSCNDGAVKAGACTCDHDSRLASILAAFAQIQAETQAATIERAYAAQCLPCLMGQPVEFLPQDGWFHRQGDDLINAECRHLRRAFPVDASTHPGDCGCPKVPCSDPICSCRADVEREK